MVWISVGDQRVSLAEFRDSWFFGQLERQSKYGGSVCVRVDIDHGLTTPGCATGRSGRRARPEEAAIIARWRRRGLDVPGWSPSDLIQFLREVAGLL